jgi:hypothetical protein
VPWLTRRGDPMLTTDTQTRTETETETFAPARQSFEEMVCWLEGSESARLTHAELEDQVERRGREVQRLMLQDHLDLRSMREERVRAIDAEGIMHANVEPGHRRHLSTVVGTVHVERLAYRHRGASNLHPGDAALNLPTGLHSHGLRRLAAIESTRGSFDDAAAAIERSTGSRWPSARWSPSPPRPQQTSRTSTRRGPPSPARATTWW